MFKQPVSRSVFSFFLFSHHNKVLLGVCHKTQRVTGKMIVETSVMKPTVRAASASFAATPDIAYRRVSGAIRIRIARTLLMKWVVPKLTAPKSKVSFY